MAMTEYMMLGLRKTAGIAFADFAAKFNQALPQAFQEVLEQAAKQDWVELAEQTCFFTPEGMLMSNEVLQKFL